MPWIDPASEDGTNVFHWPQPDRELVYAAEVPARPIAELVAEARARICAGAQGEAHAYLAEYPEVEQKTWEGQKDEAMAYLADPTTASTPILTGILAMRQAPGMTLQELAEKVLQKVETLAVVGAQIAGRRQFLDDRLKQAEAAGDRAAIEACTWE